MEILKKNMCNTHDKDFRVRPQKYVLWVMDHYLTLPFWPIYPISPFQTLVDPSRPLKYAWKNHR